MSTILENLRKFNLEQSGKVEFSNSLATSDISKKFIEKYKAYGFQGQGDSLLKEMREKNLARKNRHIDFGNELAQSDISRKYIEKYKASSAFGAPAAKEETTSLLKALRQKNMDDATSRM